MSLETRPSLTVPAVRAARADPTTGPDPGASGPSRSLPSSRSNSSWVSRAAQARQTTSQANQGRQASPGRQASQANQGRQTDRFQARRMARLGSDTGTGLAMIKPLAD